MGVIISNFRVVREREGGREKEKRERKRKEKEGREGGRKCIYTFKELGLAGAGKSEIHSAASRS